ncbi:TPA: MBL fold metallo-hydrolase [Campylobacter jejuni]|nr:MBL fold metallo-hydrolase [Campylobacter jejuni]HDZ5138031.1 MBL fold metallo-hydrolase [Campylobacter jejuni]HDZ5154867.1 MBL fold metallo-hydrolase [Campylobacter jejuni]
MFLNENEQSFITPKVSFKEILRYYYLYPKNAKPTSKLPFFKPNLNYFHTPHITWLGHSSLFVSFKEYKILIDPVFNTHASPIFFINKVFKNAPVYNVNDFDEIFAVIITHSHFDHLDKKSVKALKDKAKFFITPLKIGNYLKSYGVSKKKIIELDWWSGVEFDELKIIAIPAQHSSSRGDGKNKTLWASFVMQFPNKRIFLSADGGYFTHFKKIGEYFGGFDLACLESGQFNTAWPFSHSFPKQILEEAKDLNTKAVMPIHWGRFLAGSHAWNEVVEFLHKNLSLPLIAPKMGESYEIGTKFKQDFWWKEG